MTGTWEGIVLITKFAYTLFMWWFGARIKREERAKSLADLLAQVSSQGDLLAPQVLEQLARRSSTGWDEIQVRP